MKRKLFIHIGPAKTGTSAIQHALQCHDGSVVLYPEAGRWSDGSHHNLAFNFFGAYERPEIVREDINVLFDRIAAEARQSDRSVVISSEVLAGRKRLPDFVETLLGRLGPDFEAELLFVVRDHFERASSVYNQRVKDATFREVRDPDQFLIEQAKKLCYAPMLKPLLQAKLDVTVLDYHPADSFTDRFFAHIGFGKDQIVRASARNVSLSMKALIATLAANRICGSDEERSTNVANLSAMRGHFAPADFIFGQEAVATVNEVFRADRSFLVKRFGLRLVDEDKPHESLFFIGSDEFQEIEAALHPFPAHAIIGAIWSFVRTA